MADTFRRHYTKLTELQVAEMDDLKGKGQAILNLFDKYVPRDERSERSRCMAIARTNLEIAIMMAVKAVTSPIEEGGEQHA